MTRLTTIHVEAIEYQRIETVACDGRVITLKRRIRLARSRGCVVLLVQFTTLRDSSRSSNNGYTVMFSGTNRRWALHMLDVALRRVSGLKHHKALPSRAAR